MVMQSRYEQRYGTYTITRHPALGSSGTFTSLSTTDQFSVLISEVNSKANRKLKKPTNHKFTKSYLQEYRGSDVYEGKGPNLGYYSYKTGTIGGLPYKALNTEPPTWVYDQAVSRLYEKMRGHIDLSVDLYQVNQTVKFVKKVRDLVSLVNNFPRKALERSYAAFVKANQDAVYKRHAIRAIEKSVGSKSKVPWLRTNAIYDLLTGTIQETSDSSAGLTKAKPRYRRQGVPRDWRGAFKGPGSLWLEYRYGAGQTMQTLYDLAIELEKHYQPLMTVDGKAKELDSGSGSQAWISPWSNEYCRWNQSYQVWVRMQYKHSAETAQIMSKFTTLNPVSFIYENIPFSFVADWAYDFGGYLRNLETSYLAGSVFVAGWVVKRSFAQAFGSVSGSYSDSANSRSVSLTGGYKEYKFKHRYVLSSPPVVNPPRWKIEMSSGRMLNAAALLTNLLRK